MAKASAVLWKHTTDADGRHPVYLRFTDTHQTLYLSLRVAVAPGHWNARDKVRPVRKSHPHAEALNGLILARLADAEAARLRLLTAGEPETAQALKDALTPSPLGDDPDFLGYVEAFLVGIEAGGNPSRADKERAVVAKLRAYLAGTPVGVGLRRLGAAERERVDKKAAAVRLPLSKLTPAFLRAFETFLTGELGNKASTVDTNVRVIRLHVRRAIADGILGRDANPFDNYTPPKTVRTERARLTLEQVARLDVLDLGTRGPAGSLASRVRDYFLFALYAAGVRFGDLARLRVRDVQPDGKGGYRLAYMAGKTDKHTSAPVVPTAERIVIPYLARLDGTPKAPGDYLFPILVTPKGGQISGRRAGYDLASARGILKAVSAQNVLVNKTLRRVAEQAGVTPPEGATLSFHAARHSFADLARRGGWSVYDVKQALRHSSVAVTEGYLAGFDTEALDAQTRALFGGDSSPDAPAVDG